MDVAGAGKGKPALGSNNVCICGSLGTQAYLHVQQQVLIIFLIEFKIGFELMLQCINLAVGQCHPDLDKFRLI